MGLGRKRELDGCLQAASPFSRQLAHRQALGFVSCSVLLTFLSLFFLSVNSNHKTATVSVRNK